MVLWPVRLHRMHTSLSLPTDAATATVAGAGRFLILIAFNRSSCLSLESVVFFTAASSTALASMRSSCPSSNICVASMTLAVINTRSFALSSAPMDTSQLSLSLLAVFFRVLRVFELDSCFAMRAASALSASAMRCAFASRSACSSSRFIWMCSCPSVSATMRAISACASVSMTAAADDAAAGGAEGGAA